jgi:hypothetical protein
MPLRYAGIDREIELAAAPRIAPMAQKGAQLAPGLGCRLSRCTHEAQSTGRAQQFNYLPGKPAGARGDPFNCRRY